MQAPVPPPRWLLVVLIVYTIACMAALFPAGMMALFSPMLSDAGLNTSVWASIIGFMVAPLIVIASPIIGWIGYAARTTSVAIAGMCLPVAWLVYMVVASYL